MMLHGRVGSQIDAWHPSYFWYIILSSTLFGKPSKLKQTALVSFKNIKYWILALAAILLMGIIYSFFFKESSGQATNIVGLLLLGIVVGGIIAFLLAKLMAKNKGAVIVESSHTVVESMRKVFKIVCAEGYFNEIYNYEETNKLLGFIPATKKALVVVQAKVLVGYDFEKLKWQVNEAKRKITLASFPAPEILSIETDPKFYNMEENIFNMFSREDLDKIQQNGKKQVQEAALKSHLPQTAAEQMQMLLTEMVHSQNWILAEDYKIMESARPHELTANAGDAKAAEK